MIRRLRKVSRSWRSPVVTQMGREGAFHVLISCLLSLRTRDEVTSAASARLFALADTPERLLALDVHTLQKAIYPVAFYRNKSKTLRDICRKLIDQHGGEVPDTLEALLRLKGVGRKTANLTLVSGFDKMGICVDTHVHRICNRWGYISTKTPDESEMELRKKLPQKYWKGLNDLLVRFGQNCCKPISPLCGSCCVSGYCKKIGVKKHR